VRLRHPLLIQFPAKSDQRALLHVHDSTRTVGSLRKHCVQPRMVTG
jgi:hypothetical protein